ncbi:unnamed protein product, partial [Brenthis ino]
MPKTNAEICRAYRLRKKKIAQGYRSSVNEILSTPSTLNLSPQPVITESSLPTAVHDNFHCIIVQPDVPVENSSMLYYHRTTSENITSTKMDQSPRSRARKNNQQLADASIIHVLSNQDIVLDQERHSLNQDVITDQELPQSDVQIINSKSSDHLIINHSTDFESESIVKNEKVTVTESKVDKQDEKTEEEPSLDSTLSLKPLPNLTDEESPSKVVQRNIAAPVRLVPQQSLLIPQRPQFANLVNTTRKVYIPISGSQNQVGKTIVLKKLSPHVSRLRGPDLLPKPGTSVRMPRMVARHPVPLPDSLKQYEPPNYKNLPTAPELKLSEVENVLKMPKTNAENCRAYYYRNKNKSVKKKRSAKTNAELCRAYRLRKKKIAQGYQSSVNEILCTPSTSNLPPQPVITDSSLSTAVHDNFNCITEQTDIQIENSSTTSGPPPQPIITDPSLSSAVHDNFHCIIVQPDVPVENSSVLGYHRTTSENTTPTKTDQSPRPVARKNSQQIADASIINVLSNEDIVLDEERHSLNQDVITDQELPQSDVLIINSKSSDHLIINYSTDVESESIVKNDKVTETECKDDKQDEITEEKPSLDSTLSSKPLPNLTDDEPPSKVDQRNIAAPVRLIPQQSLLTPQRPQFANSVNTPRKVYIPISGSQNQVRQAVVLKQLSPHDPRLRGPALLPKSGTSVRISRIAARHPAPLPDSLKQYQPHNWKALPPAPELKLSNVENGIVISWKIDGYQEEDYEEIASYQLYAYRETSLPPNTALWEKIGDVEALPLPMACTLTEFMAGYKYYFAVRAVDVRSRLGPFSLPGSILLLNKM